jgi:serine protease AprX
MTLPGTARPGPVCSARPGAARRPAQGTGLLTTALAVALTASTCMAALGAVPAAAAPEPVPERVVVRVAGAGAAGVAAAASAVTAAGGSVLDRLPLVDGVSAVLPAGAVLAPGTTVLPDRPVQLSSDLDDTEGLPTSTVRETLGLGAPAGEGADTLVAVVDTGVDAQHPDLAGRVTSVDVSGAGPGDGYGHGTFVAGVVAGDGTSSGGRYAGVAPGADVLDVRVAGDDGSTDLVTVLRGLEVARAQGADVVNLSLSSYSPLPWQIDPLTVALTRLWLDGTLVVVPAGNDGPDAGTVTSPGSAPALLTVGALDDGGTGGRGDDGVADFSARGPAPQGVAKPELVAPGRGVVSLRADGSVIAGSHTGTLDGRYLTASGTSFSTAATSGAAAVLLAQRGALAPDAVKALLTGTAYTGDGLADRAAAGAGGLDLAAALTAPVPAVVGCTGRKACTGWTAVPGTTGQWQPFVGALARGDLGKAASSWSRLSPEAQQWAASSWSALPQDLRDELVADWADTDAPAEWAAREHAARLWAASSWSGRSWAGDDWAGRSWAGRSWAGRSWAGRSWAASSWSTDTWGAVVWGR